MKDHYCRVCGCFNEDKPWGDEGIYPTYDFCPCCGVEFGHEDFTLESTKEYRHAWIKNGCQWFKIKLKPNNWDCEQQMQNIPEEYR